MSQFLHQPWPLMMSFLSRTQTPKHIMKLNRNVKEMTIKGNFLKIRWDLTKIKVLNVIDDL